MILQQRSMAHFQSPPRLEFAMQSCRKLEKFFSKARGIAKRSEMMQCGTRSNKRMYALLSTLKMTKETKYMCWRSFRTFFVRPEKNVVIFGTFFTRAQKKSESIGTHVIDFKSKADDYEFRQHERVVWHITNEQVRSWFLREVDLTLKIFTVQVRSQQAKSKHWQRSRSEQNTTVTKWKPKNLNKIVQAGVALSTEQKKKHPAVHQMYQLWHNKKLSRLADHMVSNIMERTCTKLRKVRVKSTCSSERPSWIIENT